MSKKKYNKTHLPSKPTEVSEHFKFTRDFGLYLDTLNTLKKDHLIILCLKNTSGQNITEAMIEKIHKLGFLNYTTEPEKKYAGISYNGRIIYDSASEIDKPPLAIDINAQKTNFCVSFEGKEVEIKINDTNQALSDVGLNIAVYDCINSRIADISVYNALEEKDIFYQSTPEFYHRNLYYDKQYIDNHIYVPEKYKDIVTLSIRKSYFSDRKLDVREIERGVFLPRKYIKDLTYGGVCDENFNFVAGHQLLKQRCDMDDDDRHITGSYEVSPEEMTYIDETVLYAGTLIEHPGHLIVECFADRLWWLVENPDSDIKVAVETIWGNSVWSMRYNSFVAEFLDAFGISNERIIIIEKPTKFKKIIVPDQSAVPLYYCFPYEFTSEYIKPFQHIKNQLTPGKYKKIYLTKKKLYKKTVIGEEYFIDFFVKKGFKVIHPEDYTIKEKAELMYGADEIVTLDGTSSLFTVFCKPTVRLTILTRRLDYWDIPQQLINEALGIKEFYLVNTVGNFLENFSDNTFSNYASGLVVAYASKEFQKYVKYIYNEELDITPEESLKSILYEYISYFPEYYSHPTTLHCVRNIKMRDVIRSMDEIILGKEVNHSVATSSTDDERDIRNLKRRIRLDTELNTSKIKQLTDKAKEFIDENAALKRIITQLEAENEQLRRENAELVSSMTEISSMIDALEAKNDSSSEEN